MRSVRHKMRRLDALGVTGANGPWRVDSFTQTLLNHSGDHVQAQSAPLDFVDCLADGHLLPFCGGGDNQLVETPPQELAIVTRHHRLCQQCVAACCASGSIAGCDAFVTAITEAPNRKRLDSPTPADSTGRSLSMPTAGLSERPDRRGAGVSTTTTSSASHLEPSREGFRSSRSESRASVCLLRSPSPRTGRPPARGDTGIHTGAHSGFTPSTARTPEAARLIHERPRPFPAAIPASAPLAWAQVGHRLGAASIDLDQGPPLEALPSPVIWAPIPKQALTPHPHSQRRHRGSWVALYTPGRYPRAPMGEPGRRRSPRPDDEPRGFR